MRYSLSELVRRTRNPRRSQIVIRDIRPPATLATSLYRQCYLPVIDLWQEALPGIEAEYARALAQMVTDSADDVQLRIDAVDGLFQRLVLILTGRLRDWSVRTETWHRGRWRGAVLSATGVDVGTLMGPEAVREPLEAVIRRNVGLIKDVHAQAQSRITDAVFRGLNQRRPAADVAKDIRAAVDMGRARSRRIAADQLSKVAGTLAEERQREAGIETVRWRHSGKRHARPWHRDRDGDLFELETKRQIDPATRKPIEGSAPVPPDDWVGQPPWCGCRSQAVLNLD